MISYNYIVEIIDNDSIISEIEFNNDTFHNEVVFIDNTDQFVIEVSEFGAPGRDGIGGVASVNSVLPDINGNVVITIPAAQINSDWNSVSGLSEILNKPTLRSASTHVSEDFAPALGLDDNYVTDAQLIVIGNTSNTNTGDQVGDGITITGGGTIADPFVAVVPPAGYEHEYDTDSISPTTTKYIGIAILGTLTSATGWTVTKLVISSVGAVIETHATGIYDNRESLIYT